MHKRLLLLGIKGVPANHGGAETVAEELALHLTQRGWRVTVYCQEGWERTTIYETMWGRVRRVHIPVKQKGLMGDLIFNFKASLHARKQPTLSLTMGYRTALFSLIQKMRGKPIIFAMGGLEYQRPKWGTLSKLILLANARIARLSAYHLVADHPLIAQDLKKHTKESNVSLIPNGATTISDASTKPLKELDLEAGKYSTVIALPEPENSILEIVQAFSREPRGHQLVVLGDFDDDNPYHQQILASASAEVYFIGAIYDKPTLTALRYHSYLYIHGHQLGGTNPSLVEALGAGNPVLAHDNAFNRWVAGNEAARYFSDTDSCAALLQQLLDKPDDAMAMKKAARERHAEEFTLENAMRSYEKMLHRHNPYAPDPEGWEQYMDDA